MNNLEQIENEFNRNPHLSHLIKYYGSFSNLINFIDTNNLDKTKILYDMISSPIIVVISPWSYRFEIEDTNVLSTSRYKVFDKYSKLLYQVNNSVNVFGLSVLDKNLIMSSSDLDIYYLQYETFNMDSSCLTMIATVTPPYNFTPIHIDTNKVTNKINNNQQSIIYVNNSNSNLNIKYHYLISSPSSIPSIYNLLNITPVTLHPNHMILSPYLSGWFIFTDQNDNILVPTSIEGLGMERIVKSHELGMMYYINPLEYDVDSVRSSMGVSISQYNLDQSQLVINL